MTNQKIKEHYSHLYKNHGDSSKSVQYSDKISHYKRFEILAQVDNSANSFVDVGCGLGHFAEFILDKRFKGKYLGLDFVEDFIIAAKQKYKAYPNIEFQIADVVNDVYPKNYEYFILNGVFNNKTEDNKNVMFEIIKKMFNACTKGIAFNAMSTYVDYLDDNLYYSNPLEVFDFCKKNLTSKVTLRHDYLVKKNSIPFEYAIYLYK